MFAAVVLVAVGVSVPVASGRAAARASRTAQATAPAGRSWRDAKARLSLRYPTGWHVTTRNLTNITEPVSRVVIYSGAAPRPVAVAGGRPRAGQVLAIMMEQTPLSASDLKTFPRRPERFAVRHLGGVEGFGDRWAEVVFRDNGRAFYLFIGVGRNAERQLPTLLHALDTLRVG